LYINVIDVFRSSHGESAIGTLKIYQLVSNNPNPYDDLPLEKVLLVETNCVSVKTPAKRYASREDFGIDSAQIWRVTISGDTGADKIPLGSYAIVEWLNQNLRGVIVSVERKLTNRYYVHIDTSKNVPFI
jgi:hypothetical protein